MRCRIILRWLPQFVRTFNIDALCLILSYVNVPQRVIGQVNTMLVQIYGNRYKNSSAQQNVASLAFAGTVIGQLFFGWLSDHYSRKWSLMISTCILIVFAALCAGAYGYHGNVNGLFAALAAYRFLIGIGIGYVSFHSRKCSTVNDTKRRVSGWQCGMR